MTKTAEEKALEWINSQNLIYSDNMVKSLSLLLKQQDRDTRHACAEAVIQQADAPAIDMISRCHNACMNARG